MASAGSDYVIKNGFRWANPSRITYSIAPDGVAWISGTNALNATFDAKFGRGVWQREVARALATWQSVANINIVPIADGPFRVNALGSSQGDARFGDIRIGGTAIAGNQQTLAQTYFPPPQGSTAGGDVEVNLNMNYAIGSDFDLFSIVLHETGHSLGLDHPTSGKVVMRPVYGGVVTTLDAGDVAGIQAIYGARQPDVYQAQGYGESVQRPIDLTSVLTTAQVSTASAASLDSIGDVQWFSFVAPAYAGGSWQVTASASNSSMLSPKVMVYDAAGGLLAQASDPSKWSADATASLGSIVPGRRYYAAVTGATNDVFAVGSYSLTVAMSQAPGPVAPPVVPPTPPAAVIPSAPPPAAVPPNTVIPPSGPIYPTVVTISPDRFELNNSISTATRIGRVTQVSIPGLTLPAGDVDFFSFQAGAQGVVQVSAAGAIIQVLNNRGRVVAQGTDSVGVSAARNAALVVRLQAVGTSSVADSTLSISQAASARRTGFGRPTFGRPTFGRPRGRQAALPRPHALYAFEAPVWATSLKSAAV